MHFCPDSQQSRCSRALPPWISSYWYEALARANAQDGRMSVIVSHSPSFTARGTLAVRLFSRIGQRAVNASVHGGLVCVSEVSF